MTKSAGSTLPERYEEEIIHCYDPKRFCPVKLGAVFNSRYRTIANLGFGTSSTVWLARDTKYVVAFDTQCSNQ